MWDRAFVLQPLQEIAPDLVSNADIQKVNDQTIRRCE
jgi:7,8-dihydro-6-hydroxymethylpterin-pyrophosphokinase